MKKVKSKKRQLALLIAGIVLVAAAIGAGFFVRWLQTRDTASDTNLLDQKPPAIIDNAQNAALSGKVDESNKSLQDELAKPNISNEDKYNAIFQLGVNASNQPNMHQQALDYFKQAEAITQNFTVSHLIAEQYAALGNKESAIAYYKKTISQLDASSPGYDMDKAQYEDEIKALGGQP